MSGVLAGERAGIIGALELPAKWQAHAIVPDTLVPPCAVVVPGSPYLERRDGDPFGSATATFELWLITDQGPNAIAITAIDDLITQQADALNAAGFAVEQVATPFTYTAQEQGGQFLATTITVTTTITLN